MASTIDVRQKNIRAVFRLIYDRGTVSKQEIANHLMLSLPTVTQSINTLRENGLIYESGNFQSTGGRRARAISCNANVRTAIGLDVTGRHLSGAVVNLKGEVLYSERMKTEFGHRESYYREMARMVDRCIGKSGIDKSTVLGVGISLPGIVSLDRKTISKSAIIEDFSFYDHLAPFMNYPYIFVNDANAGGIAEFWHFRHSSNMVYLSLRNTVGGAIFFRDELYNGDQCLSGEIGHMALIMNGRPCYCGRKGCADTYCNAMILSDETDGDLNAFFRRLSENDPKIRKCWEDYLQYLAELINNVRNILDCEVVIGGYIGSFSDAFIDEIRKVVIEHSSFETDGMFVIPCRFKLEASAVGAGLSLVQDFIREI